MKTKTNIKAGGLALNHNETLVRPQGQMLGLERRRAPRRLGHSAGRCSYRPLTRGNTPSRIERQAWKEDDNGSAALVEWCLNNEHAPCDLWMGCLVYGH